MILAGREGIDKKLVVVDKAQKGEHLTLKVKDETLDIHKTFEGKTKTYEPIAKIDLNKLKLEETPTQIDPLEIYEKVGVGEIDISAPEYRDFIAFAPNEPITNIEVKKDEADVSYNSNLPICRLSEIEQKDVNFVLVSQNGDFQFIVIKTKGKYYKFTYEDMARIIFAVLPEDAKTALAELGLTEPALIERLRAE